MVKVNIFEAKTNLSKYLRMLLTEEETGIIIANHGKPVAKLVPYEEPKAKRVIGAAKEKVAPLPSLEEFNSDNEDISAAMEGSLI